MNNDNEDEIINYEDDLPMQEGGCASFFVIIILLAITAAGMWLINKYGR